MGYADEFNLYAYVGNDPLNRADPAGTWGTSTGTHIPEERHFQQKHAEAASHNNSTAKTSTVSQAAQASYAGAAVAHTIDAIAGDKMPGAGHAGETLGTTGEVLTGVKALGELAEGHPQEAFTTVTGAAIDEGLGMAVTGTLVYFEVPLPVAKAVGEGTSSLSGAVGLGDGLARLGVDSAVEGVHNGIQQINNALPSDRQMFRTFSCIGDSTCGRPDP